MPNFKLKPKKVVNEEEIVTLDTIHQKFTKFFRARKDNAMLLREKLYKDEETLEKLKKKNPAEYTNKDIRKKAQLKTEIQKLKEEIEDIENDHSELDYYSSVGSDLMDYYQLQKVQLTGRSDERKNNTVFKNVGVKDTTEIEYDINIHPLKRTKKQKKPVKKRNRKAKKEVKKESILSFINKEEKPIKKSTSNVTKKKLFNNYLFKLDDEFVYNWSFNENIINCPSCGVERVVNNSEGVLVCQNCGLADTVVIEPEKQSHKEPTHEKPGCPYQKINHLNEWLNQIQGKETADISDEVYHRIIKKIRTLRIRSKDITPQKMKSILKELNLTDDYEHIPYIISKITGKDPPKFTREMEDKIRQMFKEMLEPFEKYCPPERTNFLNYSYVLHKSCELLELDEYLPYFPLLKSRENLRNQDEIWKKICHDLKWEFIPSI